MKMRQFRFRAVITLDPVEPRPGVLHPPAAQYPSHTRALMIVAAPLRAGVGPARCLPAEIWQDSEEPLYPGERVVVTARVSDDQAEAFLDTGQRFTLWSGGNVGHGTVYRRVFTDYGLSWSPTAHNQAASGRSRKTRNWHDRPR
jgi:hypothetical protein